MSKWINSNQFFLAVNLTNCSFSGRRQDSGIA
jgi:hypothetical protein